MWRGAGQVVETLKPFCHTWHIFIVHFVKEGGWVPGWLPVWNQCGISVGSELARGSQGWGCGGSEDVAVVGMW